MSDELLRHYQKELAYLRKLGAEFAEKHEHVAQRLRLKGEKESDDPHVERLLEGFAFLTARIRQKLDDDFPEITEAFLGILFPHLLAPIPSLTIVEYQLDRSQGELTTGYLIPKGDTLETEAIDGEPIRFVTSYPTTLWPVEIGRVRIIKPTVDEVPAASDLKDVTAVLNIELRTYSADIGFRQLALDHLRFYLGGQSPHALALYEALHNDVLGIALSGKSIERGVERIAKDSLQPAGFAADESLLATHSSNEVPQLQPSFAPRVPQGYRLLHEYFAFPEKFLFTDLRIPSGKMAGYEQTLQIFIYLKGNHTDLMRHVDKQSLRLGCTPAVNMFQRPVEARTVTHDRSEYQLVPDSRWVHPIEVFSVDRVTMSNQDGTQTYAPFYSFKHSSQLKSQRAFWYASRRPTTGGRNEKTHVGSEMYLRLVNLDFSPHRFGAETLSVDVTATHGDLPRQIKTGSSGLRLQRSAGGPIERIECQKQPTQLLCPALERKSLWPLVSHLSLNHLSLVPGDDGAGALRALLSLYNYSDTAASRALIQGIVNVVASGTVGRVGGDVAGGFARGLGVTLTLDEEKCGKATFLFASVLERCFGLWCNINSFTSTILETLQREGTVKKWPPRAGEKFRL